MPPQGLGVYHGFGRFLLVGFRMYIGGVAGMDEIASPGMVTTHQRSTSGLKPNLHFAWHQQSVSDL